MLTGKYKIIHLNLHTARSLVGVNAFSSANFFGAGPLYAT